MNMKQFNELKKIETAEHVPQGAVYYSTEYKRMGNKHLSWYNFYNSEFEVIGAASGIVTNLLAGIVRITAAERKDDIVFNAYELKPSSDDRFYIVESHEDTEKALVAMSDSLTGRNKYEPQTRYDKNNTVQLKLKLNQKTDADILEWLESLDNKQGTIKAIIREHINQKGL